MRRSKLCVAGLLAGLASSTCLFAQEMPGTAGSDLPFALRNPYEEREIQPGPPATPPPARIIPVPVRRERPWLTLVPDLRASTGYSDNIFLTPDVFGFGTVKDGMLSVSPRLRALTRLSPEIGLIGDYALSLTKFYSHGEALQNSGTVFLGYRPTLDTHAELGIRGGTAHVTDFTQNDVEEGHVFTSGTYPLTPFVQASGAASVGLRRFPDRTRQESQALSLGLGPLSIPIPGQSTAVVEKGEQDVVTNVGGGLSVLYAPSGTLRAGYDYTGNNADFSGLDYRTHRLSVAALNQWTDTLSSQAAYSVIARRFVHATADDPAQQRKDVIHDVALSLSWTPKSLSQFWFTRSAVVRLEYDLLFSRSNVEESDFHRNFVSLTVEIGLIPLTGDQLRRMLVRDTRPSPSS